MSTRRFASFTLMFALACSDDRDGLGVTGGIYAPLGEAMPRASDEQKQAFTRGKQVVQRQFTPELGLGPTFNLVSCGGCHEKPVPGGAAGHYRDFLLTGSVQADGSYVATGKNGVQMQFAHDSDFNPTDPRTNVTATRNPIPFFGTGLLAEIADNEILRRADEKDEDGDGISGRPNYDRGFVGRFGVKAQTVSIEGFIRGPLFNHLGITSNPLSAERKAALPVPSAPLPNNTTARLLRSLLVARAAAQVAAPDMPTTDTDGVPDPELPEQDLFDLVSFSMLLAPPTPDAAPSATAQLGHAQFRALGCPKCHAEDLQGPGGLVPAFSDLLLHDMGDALADGIVMGQASGREFRTQPLWGVAATAPYLHDGRVSTLDGAIRAHGGEASAAQQAYLAASDQARAAVIEFLESLGGRDVASSGLLAPNAPIPAPGQPGAPRGPLSDEESAQFVRGREAFDRDMAIERGLGPRFNGDSCRACHFAPVIGGAGPLDVDVMREARSDGSALAHPSVQGSMLPRHATDNTRPSPAPDCGVFELRQTPSLFGAGMIDDIDEAAMRALADPDDADGDGISGRARTLADGRIGRFGWKSNVPSLQDFVRDGLSNELGLTLPASASTFGQVADDDAIADPEVDATFVGDLEFFVRELSAPQPDDTQSSDAQRAAGQAQFAALGCAHCHVPSLPARDGTSVPLYSDLLLHDVAAEAYVGIVDGDVAGRELRTPPLWGLRDTAPYLHDGSASTIEQAIAAHASEANGARTQYELADLQQRADLLAFLRSL